MPTYEIQAPNGRTYQVDGPEGASDEQVQAEVLRQYPDAGGTESAEKAPAISAQPAKPKSMYATVADPVRSVVEHLGRSRLTPEPGTKGAEAYERFRQTPAGTDVFGRKAPSVEEAQKQEAGAAKTVAEFLVPETAMEAGAMAATGPAGLAVRAARPIVRAGTKIAAGAAGGGAGGMTEGESFWTGVKRMGPATAVGETLGGLLSWGARRIPGRAARMQADYQQQVGQAVKDIVPDIGLLTSGEDFVKLGKMAREIKVAGTPQGTLGKILDDAATKINASLKGKKLNFGTQEQVEFATMPTSGARVELDVVVPNELTFDQAIGLMRGFYRKGYTADRAGKGEAAERAREQANRVYQIISTQLEQQAGPQAARLFRDSQQKYAMGLEMATQIGKALRPSPKGPFVDEMALQQQSFDRLKKMTETFKHDAASLDRWEKGVTAGKGFGFKSEISKGKKSIGEPGVTLGGRITGFFHLPRLSGNRYLGEPGPSEPLRQFLDISAQRAVGGPEP